MAICANCGEEARPVCSACFNEFHQAAHGDTAPHVHGLAVRCEECHAPAVFKCETHWGAWHAELVLPAIEAINALLKRVNADLGSLESAVADLQRRALQ